ncbi:MAG TPA: hypothetical protein PKU70_04550 [Vicinamibacteria bacterium]|nr:hypothetical protein [Vicinamibacteria bacterium]HRB12259.1 hypothetical protein [Vicinamibacteria bacterium]
MRRRELLLAMLLLMPAVAVRASDKALLIELKAGAVGAWVGAIRF